MANGQNAETRITQRIKRKGQKVRVECVVPSSFLVDEHGTKRRTDERKKNGQNTQSTHKAACKVR